MVKIAKVLDKKVKFDIMTKEWFLTMLYTGSSSLNSLMDDGCKIMVYGHDTFDEIERIVNELKDENKIEEITETNYGVNIKVLKLTAKGTFLVKRSTIIPLLKIANNKKYREAFVVANKEKCDIEFIESIIDKHDYQLKNSLKDYAQNNLIKLKYILYQLLIFSKHEPDNTDQNITNMMDNSFHFS